MLYITIELMIRIRYVIYNNIDKDNDKDNDKVCITIEIRYVIYNNIDNVCYI